MLLSIPEIPDETTVGDASWYDYDLPDYPDYSKDHYTAAARFWPRGTKLKVCNFQVVPSDLHNCVQVRVNDYGPDANRHPERIVDLSSAAFKRLAPLSSGIIPVEVTEIK